MSSCAAASLSRSTAISIASRCGSLAGSTWTWDIGTLTDGSNVSCDLVTTYDACCVVDNVATVAGDELDDPSNNSATASLNSGSNVIGDPSFEAGSPNPVWTEASTNFGTPLCDMAGCGNGGGTALPRTGDWWAWFGGIAAPEVGSVEQTVTIASGTAANLKFWLWNGSESGSGTDDFVVLIDGSQVFQVFEADPTYTGGYAEVTIDVSAFADDANHTITFMSTSGGTGVTNFSLDDVSLLTCAAFVGMGPNPLEIPTASTLGLILLSLGLAFAAFFLLRRRTA